jgi:hypothetical protein
MVHVRRRLVVELAVFPLRREPDRWPRRNMGPCLDATIRVSSMVRAPFEGDLDLVHGLAQMTDCRQYVVAVHRPIDFLNQVPPEPMPEEHHRLSLS